MYPVHSLIFNSGVTIFDPQTNIKSFFKKIFDRLKSKSNRPIRYCCIIGSFAQTAPNLRTPESDIDIICTADFDEFEIRCLLKKKFPNLPNDIPIDRHNLEFDRDDNLWTGQVYHHICYWQEYHHIPLIDCPEVELIPYRTPKDIISVARDPCKDELLKYLNETTYYEMESAQHFYHSVRKHYGLSDFKSKIDASNLDWSDKNILKTILNLESNKIVYKERERLTLDTDKHIIYWKNQNLTLYQYYRLNDYNPVSSFVYANGLVAVE